MCYMIMEKTTPKFTSSLWTRSEMNTEHSFIGMNLAMLAISGR